MVANDNGPAPVCFTVNTVNELVLLANRLDWSILECLESPRVILSKALRPAAMELGAVEVRARINMLGVSRYEQSASDD